MSRGPDAGARLERALLASAAGAGCVVTIVDATWVRWASATFTGARHTLWLQATTGEALDRWLAEVPEAEIALRDHLLADLVVTAVTRIDGMAQITVEALTLET
jgi:hypothetical protein